MPDAVVALNAIGFASWTLGVFMVGAGLARPERYARRGLVGMGLMLGASANWTISIWIR